MNELKSAFRFNDAVIRDMVLIQKEAVTEPSPMGKQREESERDFERVTNADTDTSDDSDESAA